MLRSEAFRGVLQTPAGFSMAQIRENQETRENGIEISFSCLGFLWYFKMDLNFPFHFSFIVWHWKTENFILLFYAIVKRGVDFRF